MKVVTSDDIDLWLPEVARLVLRMLTWENEGAYENWTDLEVKEMIKLILTDEINYSDYEREFPFDKWEELIKAKLNVSVNNNTSIEVEYFESGPYTYFQDFKLGDIVIVEYPDVFRAMVRIIEIKEEKSPKGNKITLTLGKKFNSLLSKIKSDSNNIGERL